MTIRQEIRARTIGYIVSAMGLIAGLAWNDAIKALIEHVVPNAGNALWLKFLYAIVITTVVVIVTVNLTRLSEGQDDR